MLNVVAICGVTQQSATDGCRARGEPRTGLAKMQNHPEKKASEKRKEKTVIGLPEKGVLRTNIGNNWKKCMVHT